ncbi:bifunctional Protein kinase domain/Protein kinase-like domain superfamily [Babesia duncani]|uniref:Bifunctional Protein kinase domain/Protein kinase-like domain superfamily n=1 Tax=Babesia duncani TaxID=323732 RepID=A0AAD9PP53_9APIC|nr:bifunctional Protein kinase domain/Protein kinase-like domain superfamily [Babesia duncani]
MPSIPLPTVFNATNVVDESKFDSIKRELSTDASTEAFRNLVQIKHDVISALATEWRFSNIEFSAIDTMNEMNTSSSSQGIAASSSRDGLLNMPGFIQDFPILNWESIEFKRLQEVWETGLNDAIRILKQHVHVDGASLTDIDAVYDSIVELQCLYYRCVQDRDVTNKLWLRLKMYTTSRRNMLKDVFSQFSPKAIPPKSGLHTLLQQSPDTTGALLKSQPFPSIDPLGGEPPVIPKPPLVSRNPTLGSSVNSATSSKSTKSTSKYKSIANKFGPESNIGKLYTQCTSIGAFKEAASVIYKKYGGEGMSLKLFHNIVDFLARSLNMPSIDENQIKRILSIYEIKPARIINEKTFYLLYWEVLHVVKNSIEIIHSVYLGNCADLSALDDVQCQSDSNTFVDINDYYEFTNKLSSGFSCNKYVARDLNTDEYVVIEILCKALCAFSFNEIQQEVAYLKQFEHQHLVSYLEVYHDLNCIYLVTEFCSGGSLLHMLQTMLRGTSVLSYSMSFVHMIFTQIIEGLLFVHCNNGVHGSLSIDKVMISYSGQEDDYLHVKLRDAGYYRFMDKQLCETPLTRLYYAPQVSDNGLCHKTDVFAAGVLLFFMVTGRMPYEDLESRDFVQHLQIAMRKSKIFKIDAPLQDLICKLLSPSPDVRPTAFEIVSHPWYLADHSKSPISIRNFSISITHLISCRNLQRDIVKAMDSQDCFYVCHLRKLQDSLELAKRADDTIMVEDFKRLLQCCNLPQGSISDILDHTSLEETALCTLEEFLAACKRWRMGELLILWSKVRNVIKVRFILFEKNLTGGYI